MRRPEMPVPPALLCPLCGSKDSFDRPGALPEGGWQFVCRGNHGTYVFEVDPDGRVSPYPEELVAGLGVRDDLHLLITNEFQRVEYGIVEHLYGTAHPGAYKKLVAEYGHAALTPSEYSTSSVIASVLGRLSADGALGLAFGPASGFWSDNLGISYWCPSSVEPAALKTWESFAVERNLDPYTWPLLTSTRRQRYWKAEFLALGPGDPTSPTLQSGQRADGTTESLLESVYRIAVKPLDPPSNGDH